MPEKKRKPKKRKIDQTSDLARYMRIRAIERNLARDVKRGCDDMMSKRGLAPRSWSYKGYSDDTGHATHPATPSTPTP